MGVSTDGVISYGIVYEEGFEFPWYEFDDVEEWWREYRGGFNPSVKPYTAEGDYAPGFSAEDPRVDVYFEELRAWEQSNPMPFEIVNYCSDDCPLYMLAVPEVGRCASRGYPEKIPTLFDDSADKLAERLPAFLDCLRELDLLSDDAEPTWYLSSYWG